MVLGWGICIYTIGVSGESRWRTVGKGVERGDEVGEYNKKQIENAVVLLCAGITLRSSQKANYMRYRRRKDRGVGERAKRRWLIKNKNETYRPYDTHQKQSEFVRDENKIAIRICWRRKENINQNVSRDETKI